MYRFQTSPQRIPGKKLWVSLLLFLFLILLFTLGTSSLSENTVRRQKESLTQALNRVLSPEFAARARAAKSPYNGGDTSGRIVKILEEKLFEPGFGAPKGFYDGPVRLQGEETR